MKIIKQDAVLIRENNPLKHIELAARTCYKSEDKISEDNSSAVKLITNLVKRGHMAMLEHFYFEFNLPGYPLFTSFLKRNRFVWRDTDTIDYKYIPLTDSDSSFIMINARTINELYTKALLEDNNSQLYALYAMKTKICDVYGQDCECLFVDELNNENFYKSYKYYEAIDLVSNQDRKWDTVRFTTDRGISHEIVRHRLASFAQESTRYCNYSKDKFGDEITVIDPGFYTDEQYKVWKEACEFSEKKYFEMLKAGCTPQMARNVLPTSLKTELVMTAPHCEWDHFFNLRTDAAAHPQIRDLCFHLNGFCFANSNTEYYKRKEEFYNEWTHHVCD